MASIASHRSDIHSSHELHPAAALRYAWYGYLVMLVCPFVLFLYVAWTAMGETGARNLRFADGWFLVAVGYMVTIVPASFFLRSRMFAAYWRGASRSPRKYVSRVGIGWI